EWGSAALFLGVASAAFAWIGRNLSRDERAEAERMARVPVAWRRGGEG
ncbi:MAG: hypothetical protein GWM92_16800, partial [Gemmatimonadetes bacterium]|nr:hypothetical protein [Gemmatimonadota bacterium]NIR80427.1 hypothetical protein [Gemmatimonadota bacterium]NIT89187.1 hypothetical protein [Gemmatimonadota bacterium]NIU32987.1 hypothetical protein [Gemmatimonadota bacterium]NIU37374.1 hypothetical protein [Gemmatimonadota bacterium]